MMLYRWVSVNDTESFHRRPEPSEITFNYLKHMHLKKFLVFKVALICVVSAKHVSSQQAFIHSVVCLTTRP
jgi:hypothetical protein